MICSTEITTLFLDIGGVLLTNGWDHNARQLAATNFKLDWTEMESRHRLNFATFEEGKLTLEEYLNWTVFYDERSFTRNQFKEFMFTQSQPYPEMIALIRKLKAKYGLKIVVVSNEARELNSHRIQKFKLYEFVDCFISSCFVHLRKPIQTFSYSLWTLLRLLQSRLYILKTHQCLSKLRNCWIFKLFFTPITNPLVRNWLRLVYRIMMR